MDRHDRDVILNSLEKWLQAPLHEPLPLAGYAPSESLPLAGYAPSELLPQQLVDGLSPTPLETVLEVEPAIPQHHAVDDLIKELRTSIPEESLDGWHQIFCTQVFGYECLRVFSKDGDIRCLLQGSLIHQAPIQFSLKELGKLLSTLQQLQAIANHRLKRLGKPRDRYKYWLTRGLTSLNIYARRSGSTNTPYYTIQRSPGESRNDRSCCFLSNSFVDAILTDQYLWQFCQ